MLIVMRGRGLTWGGGAAAVLTAAGLAAYVAVVGLYRANELAGVAGVFVGLAGVGVAVFGVIRAHRDAVSQNTVGRSRHIVSKHCWLTAPGSLAPTTPIPSLPE